MFRKRNILSLIVLLISIVFIGFIIRINLLPIKLLIILIIIVLLLNIIEIFLLNRKNKLLIILGILLMIISSIGSVAISYYVYNTNKFLVDNFNTKASSKKKTQEKEIYNIYVSGRDFATLSDFNLIVTVNKTDKKVLLTSIPRDSYIDVEGYDLKDKLSFIAHDTSLDTAVSSIENFLDIDIDYYLQVDTTSLVILVDDIGGINYCSDYEFTTTHSLVINTYNDTAGNKLHVKKGCQHFNGLQTLTAVRERNAFEGRDRVREQNCVKVIFAILDKMKSVDTLKNYQTILKDIGESYETDIPLDLITEFVKEGLNGNTDYSFETQAIDGTDRSDGRVHLNTTTDWILEPGEDTVIAAKQKIKEVTK